MYIHVFLTILLLLFTVDPDKARQANNAYENGNFAEAEQGYRDALQENPEDPRLHFNLGNALAQQGKFEDALQQYETFRGLARTPQERSLADYSIGNLHSLQEEWDKAIDQYRKSLRDNPGDEDAVHNYEWALKQLQEQQQQEQQNDDSSQDEQDSDQEQQQQQQQNQEQNQQNDQNQQQNQQSESSENNEQQEQQDQQNQDGNGEPEQQEDGSSQAQPQPQTDMTEEEAEQLLNAISNREKDLIREFLKNRVDGKKKNAKDW